MVGLEEIEDDEGSAEEVCVFVNDIYEVGFDEERSSIKSCLATFS